MKELNNLIAELEEQSLVKEAQMLRNVRDRLRRNRKQRRTRREGIGETSD